MSSKRFSSLTVGEENGFGRGGSIQRMGCPRAVTMRMIVTSGEGF